MATNTVAQLPVISDERATEWTKLELDDAALADFKAITADHAAATRLEDLGIRLMVAKETSVDVKTVLTDFLGDPVVTIEEHRDRLAAVRAIEVLNNPGYLNSLPAIDPFGPRVARSKRPFSHLELGLVRLTAHHLGTMHAGTIAFGEVGAASGEVGFITETNVVIPTGQLHLPGGVDNIRPRTVQLHPWATKLVGDAAQQRITGNTQALAGRPLFYTGEKLDVASVNSAYGMRARKVFDVAGIHDVTFLSLRHTYIRYLIESDHSHKQVRELSGEPNGGLLDIKAGYC